MKRIPTAGYIDHRTGESVVTQYAEMAVDPREIAAAERAVIEAAGKWHDGPAEKYYENCSVLHNAIRTLRAAQASQGSGK